MNFIRCDSGRGDGFVVLAEGLDVEVDGLVDEGADFVHGLAAGDAAGEVGDVGGEASVGGGFDEGDVFHRDLSGESPQRGNGIIAKGRIGDENGKLLDDGLGDDHSVEGIAVVERKGSNRREPSHRASPTARAFFWAACL